MRIGRWYLVKWHDAYSTNGTGWDSPKKAEVSPVVVISTGKCIKKTKRYVTLASSVDTTNNKVALMMTIPLGMVFEVIKIDP